MTARAFTIRAADLIGCPIRSIQASHYRLDGTCQCEPPIQYPTGESPTLPEPPVPLRSSEKSRTPTDVTDSPTRITVRIGNAVRHYTLFETTAPVNYDGFGTFGVYGDDSTTSRFALVDQDHATWQLARWSSGLCPGWPALAFSKQDLTDLLWGRIIPGK